MSQRIIVSVISDLVTDQRVHRVCTSLHNKGYDVLLIGRKKKDSLPMPDRGYKTHRFSLPFEKGALMYACFNIRLFIYLLFHKANLLLANDLDTLLPNYLAAKLYHRPLVYDSHEYFTGVPELISRPRVQGIWRSLEKWIIPRLQYFYTVNDSIAGLYEQDYGNKPAVVRNVPFLAEAKAATAWPIMLPDNKKIVVYQGAGINIDRGLEEAIEAFHFVDSAVLVVIGGGDVIDQIRQQVTDKGLGEKVFFIAKVPFEQLKPLTMRADLALSLDKDTNINYRYSLPNKLFDYIHAGVPVLASRLTEVTRIISAYNVGSFIESHDPKHLAARINEFLANEIQLSEWKRNALKAAQELNWQREQQVVLEMVEQAIGAVPVHPLPPPKGDIASK